MTKNKKLIIGISTAAGIAVPTIAIPTAIVLSKKNKNANNSNIENSQNDQGSMHGNNMYNMPNKMGQVSLNDLFPNKNLGLILTDESKPTSQEIIDALKAKNSSVDSNVFETLTLDGPSEKSAKLSSKIKERYTGSLEVTFEVQTKSDYRNKTKEIVEKLWDQEFKGKLTTTDYFSEILQKITDKINRPLSKISLKENDSQKGFYSIFKDQEDTKNKKPEMKEEMEEKKEEPRKPSTFNLLLDNEELSLEVGEVKRGKRPTKYLDKNGNLRSTPDLNLVNLDTNEIIEIGFHHTKEDEFQAINFPKNIKKVPTTLPSLITTLEGAFKDLESEIVEGIDQWDTSNITSMESTFWGAKKFNGNISKWKTTKVKSFRNMFNSAESFNGKLKDWNTENATSMNAMFTFAKTFNQDISKWRTEKVTDMAQMFYGAEKFNQELKNWNVKMVADMSFMFASAKVFNQELNDWKTEEVKSMRSMFEGASKFNKPIGTWNTNNVEDMGRMFFNATSFDQDIKNWNTDKLKKSHQYFKFVEGSKIHDKENYLPEKLKEKVKKMSMRETNSRSTSSAK
ncbi:Hypothetical protein, predicted transmembrane protein, DUF285 family [Metamycoplasma auris 15026]|uniref:PARCEL domain-containing protein n=1 Tax=Metamycoplasma auris 15026 TaxID=1188233 RepID=N9V0D3_9BACT|nr:BspA family leucine-rich repeat surface protein [Metamycoplasma auris]ENY68882.1 Hypothetical protein, predicted transmembrane protein, DUF285 family [Metamycoplasma auris 15026]